MESGWRVSTRTSEGKVSRGWSREAKGVGVGCERNPVFMGAEDDDENCFVVISFQFTNFTAFIPKTHLLRAGRNYILVFNNVIPVKRLDALLTHR